MAKDWILSRVADRGPGRFYRYRVAGENLNFPVGHPNRQFTWDVPMIDEDRYDLTNAVTVEER